MYDFGFVNHFLNTSLIYQRLRLAKLLGISEVMIKRFSPWVPPYRYMRLGPVFSTNSASQANGVAIACPILPEHFVLLNHKRVLKIVVSAIQLAHQSGAKIVGLGGLTSSFTEEGEEVVSAVDVAITSGNTYTAVLTIRGLLKAVELLELPLSDCKVAVIGATGDIGSACTRALAKRVKEIVLAARNEKRLNGFARKIQNETSALVRIARYTSEAVREADLIVTATSAVTTIIEPKNLKPGAIICDVAYPANVARDVLKYRDDIFIFEGGLATWPSYELIEDKIKLQRFSPPGTVHGCLAETMILALEKRFVNFSLGRGKITETKIEEMNSLAEKHGFGLAPFQYAGRIYSQGDIEAIKQVAFERRRSQLTTAMF